MKKLLLAIPTALVILATSTAFLVLSFLISYHLFNATRKVVREISY